MSAIVLYGINGKHLVLVVNEMSSDLCKLQVISFEWDSKAILIIMITMIFVSDCIQINAHLIYSLDSYLSILYSYYIFCKESKNLCEMKGVIIWL